MPDLNSVPPSPRPLAASRSQSNQKIPPEPPSPSLNILPSNQNAVNQTSTSSPGTSSTQHVPQQTSSNPPAPNAPGVPLADPAVGSGPGPLRHPRPLTAMELHLQLEKEQEAVVNRLTRELSALRAAQNASVASNTSSTSASNSAHEAIAEPSLLSGSGFTIPTSRRHHRTSSSASQNLASQLLASHDGRPHAARPPQPVSMSRQNSSTSRRSQTSSPAPQSFIDSTNYFQQQRMPPPSSVPMVSGSASLTPHGSGPSEQLSPGLISTTARFEETQLHRQELESVKSENDTLKRRIRELERQLQERRASVSSRPRSESVSTTASVSVAPAGGVSIAGPREGAPPRLERDRSMTAQSVSSVGVGVPEDEVRVGESAASSRPTESST